MKNLGKHDVEIEVYLDGKLSDARVEQRVVLFRQDGTYHCWHMGRPAQIERIRGRYRWRQEIRALQVNDLAEILRKHKVIA